MPSVMISDSDASGGDATVRLLFARQAKGSASLCYGDVSTVTNSVRQNARPRLPNYFGHVGQLI
jgi:hypothetical protein